MSRVQPQTACLGAFPDEPGLQILASRAPALCIPRRAGPDQFSKKPKVDPPVIYRSSMPGAPSTCFSDTNTRRHKGISLKGKNNNSPGWNDEGMEPGVTVHPSSPGASKDVVKKTNLSCAEQGNIVFTAKHLGRKSEPGFAGRVGWTGL